MTRAAFVAEALGPAIAERKDLEQDGDLKKSPLASNPCLAACLAANRFRLFAQNALDPRPLSNL